MDTGSNFNDLKHATLNNGETLAYREQSPADSSKPGETILFLHATLCSSTQLNTGGLLDKLTETYPHARFVAPDLRGQGHSTYNKKIESNADLADDLKLFLDVLKIEKVSLIGTCLGGYVSGIFASRYPEYLNCVIFIGALSMLGGNHMFSDETFPKTTQDIDKFPHFMYMNPCLEKKDKVSIRPMLDGFHAKNWVSAKNFDLLLDDIILCQNLREVFYGEAHGNYSSVNNGRVEGSREVEKITTRALIIHGVEDKTIPIDHARQMAKAIKGCVINEMPGADHFTWHDDLEGTINHIKAFI